MGRAIRRREDNNGILKRSQKMITTAARGMSMDVAQRVDEHAFTYVRHDKISTMIVEDDGPQFM